jgi:hypothetical protein
VLITMVEWDRFWLAMQKHLRSGPWYWNSMVMKKSWCL